MAFFRLIASCLYGLGVGFRNELYEMRILRSWKPPVPTVCIGNLAVGGTGKTPHSILLLRQLKDEYKVAFLSRGYKRSTHGFVLAGSKSTTRTIGDEPMQVYLQLPDVPVAVCEDRIAGIKELLRRYPDLDCIILDDAMQHRRIKPGYTLLLTAYDNLYVNDHLLPYGRLRETHHGSTRADMVVVTKCPDTMTPIDRRVVDYALAVLPYQQLVYSRMSYMDLQSVFQVTLGRTLTKQTNVCMFTGIASPQYMQDYVETEAAEVVSITFSDHHLFTKKDVKKIENVFAAMNGNDKLLLTTEKDAMRLRELPFFPEHLKESVYYLPMHVEIIDEQDKFIQNIKEYVRENKRNCSVHTR